jgi:glutamate dehydrogenase (NAD(P)+)
MGNVGSNASRLMRDLGHKIVAVSDASGGLYDTNGLDVEKIVAYLKDHPNSLITFPKPDSVQIITNEELLISDCDVLIPCAMASQISVSVAEKLKAKLIVEGANGPTTVKADEILAKRNIPVIPDILANAGGVIVSYFEWVQNLQNFAWEEDQVNSMLKQIMTKSFSEVLEIVKDKKVDFRIGAYMLAVSKLVRAKKSRGIFP